MWRHEKAFNHTEKIFLNVGLTAFYLLGFVSTLYWLGMSWYIGVIPAFVLFLLLFAIELRTAYTAVHGVGHGGDREAPPDSFAIGRLFAFFAAERRGEWWQRIRYSTD